MKIIFGLVLATVMLFACSNNSDSSPQDLNGNWIYINESSSTGLGLTLNPSGTYTMLFLTMATSNSAYVAAESGTFIKTDTKLNFHPLQTTCVGITPEAAADSSYFYEFNNLRDTLAISNGSLLVNLNRNQETAAANFAVQFGCFKEGKFVSHQLQNVN